MVREIIHDPIFLSKKSQPATLADLSVAKDLLDTLIHNREGCVGMAANMIGETKRIIVFDNNGLYMTMLNPEIVSRFGVYEAQEGCLSLSGVRSTKRFKTIKVRYQNLSLKVCEQIFTDFTAQIIQHEIDHCNGILI